ncbi:phenylalanine-trna ligase [Phytophthora cinnamomi]|uniref:phenylalanine-trna ligase n=1 Tax=Phytophthora cinnamomi TaxID=4785 RepID=UPI00355ACD5D|nr:phenylalanine-trna ligase [Phytophthora cinnamomi]
MWCPKEASEEAKTKQATRARAGTAHRLSCVSMEEVARNPTSPAGDWKRRFQRETKVNKELGRRLRETKHQLEEERLRSQELTTQLLHYKRHLYGDEKPNKQDGECCNCERLDEEIAKLKRIIAEAGFSATQELDLESKNTQHEKDECTPERNFSEFEQEDPAEKQTDGSSSATQPVPFQPSVANMPLLSTQSAVTAVGINGPETDDSNQYPPKLNQSHAYHSRIGSNLWMFREHGIPRSV